MGINYQTLKTKEDIANVINNSGLPAINIMFILDSIRSEVASIVNQAVESEREEEKEGGNANE